MNNQPVVGREHPQKTTKSIVEAIELLGASRGREYIQKTTKNVVEVIELLDDGRLRFKDLASGKFASTGITNFMANFDPRPLNEPKMYDVFLAVHHGETQATTTARVLADNDDDAVQMALEWECYVDAEEITRQLAEGGDIDDFTLWDSGNGIGYIITDVVELQEVAIQVLAPLARPIKPVYVPRYEQGGLINAHYYK